MREIFCVEPLVKNAVRTALCYVSIQLNPSFIYVTRRYDMQNSSCNELL